MRLMEKYSAENARVRARENYHTPTQSAKELIDYTSASAEMQANSLFEQRWLDFMHGWIKENGSIPKKEAINGGAAVAGCNPSTTARYLEKYCSVACDCFKESRDSTGAKIITYR